MDLLSLKVKSIRTQLDYLKVDFEYKQKMVEEGDKNFLDMLNEVLGENPELQKQYLDKEEKMKESLIEATMNKAQEEEQKYQDSLTEEEVEEPSEEIPEDSDDDIEPTPESKKDKKVKKLYRQIVKLTHPDKIEDETLNELYLESTEYYNDNNILGIYRVCDILSIEYDLEEHEVLFMDQEINELRDRIGFIEGTYTWKWSTAPDDNIKKQIVIEFINMKLNQ